MRDYAAFISARRVTWGCLTPIMRRYNNWRTRNDLRRLQSMGEHELRDIGLTSSDLHHLLHLPHVVDLRWETERLRLFRARQ